MRRGSALALLALLAGAPGAWAQSVQERLPLCLSCHGEKGTSETAGVPSIGGQPSEFLLIQLYQFRENARIAPPMNDMAKGLTDDDLRELSDTLSKLPLPEPAGHEDASADRARGLVATHRCAFCHNADFSGHDQIPRIAPQREDYLVKALTEYRTGERPGYDPAMNEAAQRLTDADIAELARFLATRR